MKRRMLFVDDEPMILQGLQRILRSWRGEWEMEFFDNAAAALHRLTQAPFDVVLSDLQMPGINGADFLAEVKERHPRTIRLILSGHADPKLILQSVGSAHQFLAKPCDPDALKSILGRVAALEAGLPSEALRQLVGQLVNLPSVPSLYLEIAELADRSDASLEAIAQVISRDLNMTTRILRLVNSPFFGLSRGLSSTEEAVAHLGLEMVKALVLSLGTFSHFEQTNLGRDRIQAVWSHSRQVGARAKQIAQLEGAERMTISHAYTAGMLHDVGKLLLAANLSDKVAQAARLAATKGMEDWAAEELVFGASHADVGGYLLGLWGLPEPVVEAVTWHHRPCAAAHLGFSPLTAVHVANAYTCQSEGSVGCRYDNRYLAAAGAEGRLPVWRASLDPAESLGNPR